MMDDESESAYSDRIRWISHVTDYGREGDLKTVWRAIEEVDEEHLRSLILVLVLSRVDDHERMREHYAEWMRERLSDWPLQSDN
jgi:hypothetical protein